MRYYSAAWTHTFQISQSRIVRLAAPHAHFCPEFCIRVARVIAGMRAARNKP